MVLLKPLFREIIQVNSFIMNEFLRLVPNILPIFLYSSHLKSEIRAFLRSSSNISLISFADFPSIWIVSD